MPKCCICGRNIEALYDAVMVMEIDSENNLMCSACENMLTGASMTDSAEYIKKSFDYFAGYMEKCRDANVRAYLKDLLLSLKESFKETTEEAEDEVISIDTDDEESENFGSGVWLNILYTCAWINIIVGISVSIFLGITVGSLTYSELGGIIAATAGLLITFTFSALIMVALNAANDIRATRYYAKDIRDALKKYK